MDKETAEITDAVHRATKSSRSRRCVPRILSMFACFSAKDPDYEQTKERALHMKTQTSKEPSRATECASNVQTCEMSNGLSSQHKGPSLHRFFGRSVLANPRGQLQEAIALIEERVEMLAQKEQLKKAEALNLMQNGDKARALSLMKKANLIKDSRVKSEAACMALERQLEVMEEASVQKKIAGAIAASAKSMKGACKGMDVTATEKAIDDAQEAKDGISDLQDAISGFGESVHELDACDDETLMQELYSMMEEADSTHDTTRVNTESKSSFTNSSKKMVAKVQTASVLPFTMPAVPKTSVHVAAAKMKAPREQKEMLISST